MKKFLSAVLILFMFGEAAMAFPADTTGWACSPEHVGVNASEIDLNSDIKDEYRLYQTTITNITSSSVDVFIPANQNADEEINKMLESGLTFKNLIEIPKQIAIDCYNEDVGTGNIAKARKGLIYVLATAGAAVAGVGMLGVYPQQKFDEYLAHKKIKKEYKKTIGALTSEFTLAPLSQADIVILVPINNNSCLIRTKIRDIDEDIDIYSDYHQL